jgi:glutamate racemase
MSGQSSNLGGSGSGGGRVRRGGVSPAQALLRRQQAMLLAQAQAQTQAQAQAVNNQRNAFPLQSRVPVLIAQSRPTTVPNPKPTPRGAQPRRVDVNTVYELRIDAVPTPKPAPAPKLSSPWVARALVEQRGEKYYLVGYVLADGDNRAGVYYTQPEIRGHGPNVTVYQPGGTSLNVPPEQGRSFKFDVPAQEIKGARSAEQAIATAQRNLDNGTWSVDTAIRAVTGKSAKQMTPVERLAFVLSLAVAKGTGEGIASVYEQFTTPQGLAEIGALLALIASPAGAIVELGLIGQMLLSLGVDAVKFVIGIGSALSAETGSSLMASANLATDLIANLSSTFLSGVILKPLINGARAVRSKWRKGDGGAGAPEQGPYNPATPGSPTAALEFVNGLDGAVSGGKLSLIGLTGANNIVPFFRRGHGGGGSVTVGGNRGGGGVSTLLGNGPVRVETMSVGELARTRSGSGLSGGEALKQLNLQLASSPELVAVLPKLKPGQGFTTLIGDGRGSFVVATVTGVGGGGAVTLTLDDWNQSGVIGRNPPTVRVTLSGNAGSPLSLASTQPQPLPSIGSNTRIDVADLGKTATGIRMAWALSSAQQNSVTLAKLSAGEPVYFSDGGKAEPVSGGNVKFTLNTGEYYVAPYNKDTRQFTLPEAVRKLIPIPTGNNSNAGAPSLTPEQLRQAEAQAEAAHQQRLAEIREQSELKVREIEAEGRRLMEDLERSDAKLSAEIDRLKSDVARLTSNVQRLGQDAALQNETLKRMLAVGTAYLKQIRLLQKSSGAWNANLKKYTAEAGLLTGLQSKLERDLRIAEQGGEVNVADLRKQVNRIRSEYGSPNSPPNAQTAYGWRNKLNGTANSVQGIAEEMAAQRRADINRGDNFLTDYDQVAQRGAQTTRSVIGVINQRLAAGLEWLKGAEQRVRVLEDRVLSPFGITGEGYRGKLGGDVFAELNKRIEAEAKFRGTSVEQELARLTGAPDEAAVLLGGAIVQARGKANGLKPAQIETLQQALQKEVLALPAQSSSGESPRLDWVKALMSEGPAGYKTWLAFLNRNGLGAGGAVVAKPLDPSVPASPGVTPAESTPQPVTPTTPETVPEQTPRAPINPITRIGDPSTRWGFAEGITFKPFPGTTPVPVDPSVPANPGVSPTEGAPQRPGDTPQKLTKKQLELLKGVVGNPIWDSINESMRLAAYERGQISRAAATAGLSGDVLRRMNARLDAIEASQGRGLGFGGSSVGSGRGPYRTSDVKRLWKDIDRAGGVGGLPEETIRRLQGITESAVKNSDASAADRAEFQRRLDRLGREQTKIHEAREKGREQVRQLVPLINPITVNQIPPAVLERLGQAIRTELDRPDGLTSAQRAQYTGALDAINGELKVSPDIARETIRHAFRDKLTGLTDYQQRLFAAIVFQQLPPNASDSTSNLQEALRSTNSGVIDSAAKTARLFAEGSLANSTFTSGAVTAQPTLAPYRVVIVDSSDGGIIASDVIQAELEKKLGRPVQVIVIGDHRNAPYGNKPKGELPSTVNDLLRVAQELNPDAVFIACNTACTQLPLGADKGVQVPLVDIVTITSEYIAKDGGDHPAIFATRATVDSGAYGRTVSAINPNIKVTEVATPELATLVNEGANTNPKREAEVRAAVKKYVARLPKNTTSVWLCCTHYPALERYIREELDARGMTATRVVDPMSRVAGQVGDGLLQRQNRGEPGNGVAGVPLVVVSSGRSINSGYPDGVNVGESVTRYNPRPARVIYTTPFSAFTGDTHLDLVRQAIATPSDRPPQSPTQGVSPTPVAPPGGAPSGSSSYPYVNSANIGASGDPLERAARILSFKDRAESGGRRALFNELVNLFDGQPITDVMKTVLYFNTHNYTTFAERRTQLLNITGAQIRGQLDKPAFSPQLETKKAINVHNFHTAFGAGRGLNGEVLAFSNATLATPLDISIRVRLPDLNQGTTTSGYFRVAFTSELKIADEQLALLEANPATLTTSVFNESAKKLFSTGAISYGSPLAKRLEEVEKDLKFRERLQLQIDRTSNPADRAALQTQYAQASKRIEQNLSNPQRSRDELILQAFGTVENTANVIPQQIAIVRYLKSIEGRRNAVFDAKKLNAILAQVTAELGADASGVRLHQDLIKTYDNSAAFRTLLQSNPLLGEAWKRYKIKHGSLGDSSSVNGIFPVPTALSNNPSLDPKKKVT